MPPHLPTTNGRFILSPSDTALLEALSTSATILLAICDLTKCTGHVPRDDLPYVLTACSEAMQAVDVYQGLKSKNGRPPQ